MNELQSLYRHRFDAATLPAKNRIWQVLCRDFFQRYVDPGRDCVLDVACGYGEFVNNIRARRKLAIDLNPDSPRFVAPDVEFHAVAADALAPIAAESVDVAFTSNFLEHLPDKATLVRVFAEIRRVLRPGGTFIVLGPNIRYLPGEYWDFFDHHLPLSHLSLVEGLRLGGFEPREVIDRFLPYTTQSSLPKGPGFVAAYLRLRPAWRFFGKQFLVVASRAATPRTEA
jgi:SAM-dependent methyltransferase